MEVMKMTLLLAQMDKIVLMEILVTMKYMDVMRQIHLMVTTVMTSLTAAMVMIT